MECSVLSGGELSAFGSESATDEHRRATNKTNLLTWNQIYRTEGTKGRISDRRIQGRSAGRAYLNLARTESYRAPNFFSHSCRGEARLWRKLLVRCSRKDRIIQRLTRTVMLNARIPRDASNASNRVSDRYKMTTENIRNICSSTVQVQHSALARNTRKKTNR